MKNSLIIKYGYFMSGVMLGFSIDYFGNANFKAGLIFLSISVFATLMFIMEENKVKQ
jgi:hypothetical protein